MAAKLTTGGNDDLDVSHEINVTPFIDVILVLLIIFMVAAPLSTVDVNVELPAATATPTPRPQTPVFVTLKPDRTLALGEEAVARDDLGPALERATEGRKDQRLFVRADKSLSYGEVIGLMNLLREHGYLKIGLVALDGEGRPGNAPNGHPPTSR